MSATTIRLTSKRQATFLRVLCGSLGLVPGDRLELVPRIEAGAKASVSDLVVSEVYFALRYHYRVPEAEALNVLKGLLEAGEIVATGAALGVLRTPRLASAKPGFVDRLIHQGYRDSGEAMATFERRAPKLEGVRVL